MQHSTAFFFHSFFFFFFFFSLLVCLSSCVLFAVVHTAAEQFNVQCSHECLISFSCACSARQIIIHFLHLKYGNTTKSYILPSSHITFRTLTMGGFLFLIFNQNKYLKIKARWWGLTENVSNAAVSQCDGYKLMKWFRAKFQAIDCRFQNYLYCAVLRPRTYSWIEFKWYNNTFGILSAPFMNNACLYSCM